MTRRREFGFLLLTYAVLGLGHFVVWQTYLPTWRALYQGQDWWVFLPLGITFLAWLVLSIALTVRQCRETLLVPTAALLIGTGLLFLQRLAGGAATLAMQSGIDITHLRALVAGGDAPRLAIDTLVFLNAANKQLISFGVGMLIVLGLVLLWRDYRGLARHKYLIALTAIGLLLVTTLLGSAVGGQQLTLNLGFITFQPHDPVKLLLVIFMAAYLVEKTELLSFAAGRGTLTSLDFRYMGPLVALWLLVMLIVFKHNDLGAMLLLFGAFLGILYLGTSRKTYLAIGLVLFVLGGMGAYAVSSTFKERVAIWLDPWSDVHGAGYQITQGLMALGNGRVVGAGLAGGYPERIYAIHTDYIYAAISEDLGLVGAVAVVGLFLVLLGRIVHVALQAQDRFGQLLAGGLAVALAVQAWVIIAGTIKLIPLTGITLPFISYGGTSLVVNMVLLGIVLKVAEPRPSSV